MDEALYYLHVSGVVFGSGDMGDGAILAEDETIAILANDGQVRQYLHQKKLDRGYVRHGKGKGKGKSKGKTKGKGKTKEKTPKGGSKGGEFWE